MKRNIFSKFIILLALALCGFLMQSCHVIDFVPQVEVTVEGHISDVNGNPIAGLTVSAMDYRQNENNDWFGSMADDWQDEQVAQTKSDENGNYKLTFMTDQQHFSVSAGKRMKTNDNMISYGGGKNVKFQKNTANYVVDFKVKTATVYYTSDVCDQAVMFSKRSVHDIDTIHVKLLDGGSIEVIGAGIDYTDVNKEGVTEHDRDGWFAHYNTTNGGYNAIPEGLTEFDLPIAVGNFFATTSLSSTNHPCFYIVSVQPNETHDTKEYLIPIELLDHPQE